MVSSEMWWDYHKDYYLFGIHLFSRLGGWDKAQIAHHYAMVLITMEAVDAESA